MFFLDQFVSLVCHNSLNHSYKIIGSKIYQLRKADARYNAPLTLATFMPNGEKEIVESDI